MVDSRSYGENDDAHNDGYPPQAQAGIITKIKVENFMCHSSMEIELGEWVNFITGQNGSGKSAILTALCVAFGSRAKSTERAATLKDFLKTGCSSATVSVDISNKGIDAFKPETYGNLITIERRISAASSSTILKDHQGRKVADKKADLSELIEHFNIDVQNPCVIMTQDKSREFLHSGNVKDRFKFYFKATLLQQLNDILDSIAKNLQTAETFVIELEKSISPAIKELKELEEKIKNMEHVEEIAQQVQQLKKRLAWSWVYDIDRQIQGQLEKIKKFKDRIPACESKIEDQKKIIKELEVLRNEMKTCIDNMIEDMSEVKKMREELKLKLSLATKERIQLQEERTRRANYVQTLRNRLRSFEQQAQDIQEEQLQSTQAEKSDMEKKRKELMDNLDEANSTLRSLIEEEKDLSQRLSVVMDEIQNINGQIEGYKKQVSEIQGNLRELRKNQTNKVTAFGGDRVIQLLRVIERHHQKFTKPPIGPIGVHLKLIDGDRWAPAVENAIGKLLNSFIVTNHKDSMLLRSCAREANFNYLQILIYDFARPRLTIPPNMRPQTDHPTTLSVVHSDLSAVYNVLVDMGQAERQVLVRDYDVGKTVAFDQRIQNLKEVYTLDGYKMFSRASVQTILPPNKRAITGRLCGSYDGLIKDRETQILKIEEQLQDEYNRKRKWDGDRHTLEGQLQSLKRRRIDSERDVASKKLAIKDLEESLAAESSTAHMPTVDEIHQEISKIRASIDEKENSLGEIKVQVTEVDAKVEDLRISFDTVNESGKRKADVLGGKENELINIEEELLKAKRKKTHYEEVMIQRVLPEIKEAEAQLRELEQSRQENSKKASVICPESEIEPFGSVDSSPEQLSANLNRLNQRLQRETQRYSESVDDLRMLYAKKERKILKKQQAYEAFREKLQACFIALDARHRKFQRNATLMKRQLQWRFNNHLGKKGVSGTINLSYEEKTLNLEIKMPQDASSGTVRDTRGLSGGERSYSTLCFTLALHEMTEAPFRAMDEFDVFMDAVSRKISLDTLVDFALNHGSQWIFITPHDISMVKQDERVKKQQMAPPRS